MQQMYRRAPMPKYDFNKVTKQEQNYSAEKTLKNFWKFTWKNLRWRPLLVKLHLQLFCKATPLQEFSDDFGEIFQSSYSSEHLWTVA